jgi:hypothetical protein
MQHNCTKNDTKSSASSSTVLGSPYFPVHRHQQFIVKQDLSSLSTFEIFGRSPVLSQKLVVPYALSISTHHVRDRLFRKVASRDGEVV